MNAANDTLNSTNEGEQTHDMRNNTSVIPNVPKESEEIQRSLNELNAPASLKVEMDEVRCPSPTIDETQKCKIINNQVSINNNEKVTIGTEKFDLNAEESGALPFEDEEKKKRKGAKAFWQGVKADLFNKDLFPLKILFFFKYATLFVLYPFLPLHLKSLGLTATENGINSALIPIFVILAPPFSGMLADKIGNFKVYLTFLTVMNAPFALALLLVPQARHIVTYPEKMTFEVSCSGNERHSWTLRSLDKNPCMLNSKNSTLDFDNGASAYLQCGSLCSSFHEHDMHIDFSVPASLDKIYKLPDSRTFKISNSLVPYFKCPTRDTCTVNITEIENLPNSEKPVTGLEFKIKKLNLNLIPDENMDEIGLINPDFDLDPIGGLVINKIEFGLAGEAEVLPPQCHLHSDSVISDSSNCKFGCLIQIERSLICSNKAAEEVYDVILTFSLYTLLRIFLGVASATSFIMFEGAVMAILKEFGGDYGLQRVTATLAAIIFAPLSGVLIQWFGSFYPAFYLYAVLQVGSGLLTLLIDLEFKTPTHEILGHLKEVLTQIEILIFFAAMLLSGTAWGYLESFLFWYLEDLGASNVLMGLTISVGGLFGIPVLILSRPIIKRFGHVNILCIGLLFYGIRLVGYSFIEDPWLCLPFEGMEAITASLAITAAATYAAALSSAETIASIQGIWGGLYFGFGRGAGSLMGGFFHKWFGARHTFRIFSIMSVIGGILYFFINRLYVEKYTNSIRKTMGINLNDIRGDRKKRALVGEPQHIQDTEKVCEKWPMDKCEGGYVGPCEVDFTDIPLDEETPPVKPRLNPSTRDKSPILSNPSNLLLRETKKNNHKFNFPT